MVVKGALVIENDNKIREGPSKTDIELIYQFRMNDRLMEEDR